MKFWKVVLSLIGVLAHFQVGAAPVASTVGNNLTAYNGSAGAMNNNNWNNMINGRSTAAQNQNAKADFGNCNSLVLRCATPKCGTGCTDYAVATQIASGCVNASDACKKHGDDLVAYIAAQLVATATDKANTQATQAQIASAQASAGAQNNEQLIQMQNQMAQMQQQMQAQTEALGTQLQAALEENKQLAASAAANAQNATPASSQIAVAGPNDTTSLTQGDIDAIDKNVSADVLAREKIAGQILTQIEDAELSLKKLKNTMQNAFEYAGCDKNGNNCNGPKRVARFKELARDFFDPYNDVLDDTYEALILAQGTGIDISDIYMMLNNTCAVWGKYLCRKKNSGDTADPDTDKCDLLQMLTDQEEVQRGWIDTNPDASTGVGTTYIWVKCASDALDNSVLFKNRKKAAKIDIDVLERILDQDANPRTGQSRQNKDMETEYLKYCAITDQDLESLQKYANSKSLPKKGICINEKTLDRNMNKAWVSNSDALLEKAASTCQDTTFVKCTNEAKEDCDTTCTGNMQCEWDSKNKECRCKKEKVFSYELRQCFCEGDKSGGVESVCDETKTGDAIKQQLARLCIDLDGKWDDEKCDCLGKEQNPDKYDTCHYRFCDNFGDKTYCKRGG